MKKHTKCHMNEICKIPHRDGECEINCYYNTIEVKTNADRIRRMSDEELAELFANWIQDCGCNNVPCREPCKKKLDADIFEAAPCEKNWLDWLRQESEKDA